MLRIEDLKSGQFYTNGAGQLIYVLKIIFEDTIQKFKHDMEQVKSLPTHDHLVYRIIGPGRYDMVHQAKYSWFKTQQKFLEVVDKQIFYDEDRKVHWISHQDQSYLLSKICAPAYTVHNVHSQAKPYKFPYKLVLGKEYPDEKSNLFEQQDFNVIAEQLGEILGFESFLYFNVIGASMYGGDTIQYGLSLWFRSEEDYNLARLILPIKFS